MATTRGLRATAVLAVAFWAPAVSFRPPVRPLTAPVRAPAGPRPAATTALASRAVVRMDDAAAARGMPVPPAPEEGYTMLLELLVRSEEANVTASDMVAASYEKIDYTFMQKLAKDIEESQDEGRKEALKGIQSLINAEMQARMSTAADSLRKLLAAGPGGMFKLLPDYMQRGLLDEPLLLLLEANIRQARDAGAAPAAELMGRLLQQARLEIDKAVAPEVRLLRELLRIESSDARKERLKQRIAPKENAILIAGAREAPASKEPAVKIRKFVQALIKVKAQFGNLGDGESEGLAARLALIAGEAEAVAREFGEGSDMTPQELQDLMWDKGTVSVWDLEKVEEEAEETGGAAPWDQDQAARVRGLSQDDLLL